MSKLSTIAVSLLTLGATLLALAGPVEATHSPTANVDRSTIYEIGSQGKFVSANFTGAYTADAGETIVSVTWVWGDGTTSSGFNPQAKSYKDAGTYAARLDVLVNTGGNNFATRSKTVPITVVNAPPTHTHNVPSITTNQPLAVDFDLKDNQGIASATLFYRKQGDTSFLSQQMSRQGNRDATTQVERWTYSIPASFLTGPVEYYVRASDVSANDAKTVDLRPSATTYYVASGGAGDVQPPVITLSLTGTQILPYGTGFPIIMGLSDASGVQSATFYHKKQSEPNSAYGNGIAVNLTTKAVVIPWSATVAGAYNWYVSATDTRSNTATLNSQNAPGTFTLVVGPGIAMTVPTTVQKLTPGAQLQLAGTTEDDKDGVTAKLQYNTGSGWSAAVDMTMGSGTGTAPVVRSVTGSIPMPAGEFAARNILFYVNATDSDGNARSSGLLSVRVATDVTPPEITGDAPSGAIKALAPIAAAWSDAGSGVDAGSVVVRIGTVTVPTGEITANASGFTIAATAASVAGLAEGTHTVNVTVADATGNVATKHWTFVLDKTAPTISGAGLDGVLGLKPTIAVTFSDAGSGIAPSTATLKIDGVVQTISATATGFTFVPTADLAAGKRTILVTVEDAAGNVANFTKEIEIAAPAAVKQDGFFKRIFGIPGFELLAVFAALGAALVVLRRRS